MRTALNACLIVLVLVLAGCGSVSSRWRGERSPYSGVKLSAHTVKHFNHESELLTSVIDVPLSAIVDTLYLPYDLTGDKPAETNRVATVAPSTGRIGYKR